MPSIRVSLSIIMLLIGETAVLPGAAAQAVSPPLYKMSTIMGQAVESKHGDQVGLIKDVVLEATTGDLVYAVLVADGFLGIGEKLFAVPWHAVQQPTEGKPFRLDMTAEQLKKAPSLDRHQWPDLEDRHWGDTIHAYYGQPPYWGKRLPTKTARETIRPIEPTQRLLRASFVLRRGVINTQEQWLGDIQDVVIDSAADHVLYAVLSVGKGPHSAVRRGYRVCLLTVAPAG